LKNIIYLLISVFALHAQLAFADTCGREFGLDVAYCAQSTDFLNLSPKERADEKKMCVAEANAAKEACQSGVNLCVTACQTAYDTNVFNCEQTYDPAACGGNVSCEAVILSFQANCISSATNTFNSCISNCQL
jgi:hypothetical protein